MGFFEFFINLGHQYGAVGIFTGSLLESIGVPFAGTSLVLASGYLISSGRVTFVSVIIAGTLGNVVGSSISYYIGYLIGNRIRKKRGRIFKNDSSITEFIRKHGSKSALLAQLYGTTRAYISYPAGLMRMNYKKFITYTALGGLIFSIFVSLFSLYIRNFYYKILYPYIGLSFGAAAITFMLAFVITHFIYHNSEKIKQHAKNILNIEDENNEN